MRPHFHHILSPPLPCMSLPQPLRLVNMFGKTTQYQPAFSWHLLWVKPVLKAGKTQPLLARVPSPGGRVTRDHRDNPASAPGGVAVMLRRGKEPPLLPRGETSGKQVKGEGRPRRGREGEEAGAPGTARLCCLEERSQGRGAYGQTTTGDAAVCLV